VNATEATFPLAVPLTLERPLPQRGQVITDIPVTVDPFCVSVNVIGTAALPPNVPDHVPLNGPEDGWAEGLVGDDDPPPHPNPITVIKITARRFIVAPQ
jgi:hypothetical protein